MTLAEANAAWSLLADNPETTDDQFQELQDKLELEFEPVWHHDIVRWEAKSDLPSNNPG